MVRRFQIYSALFITIFIIIPSGMVQALDSLDNAHQAYINRDYISAIQFLELTVNGGIYNGDIFYNLGNAYYENGDIDQALLNYRRAIQFIPRDLDLNIQLARALSNLSVVPRETSHPLIMLEQATSNVFTINELSIITLTMWTVFWVLVIVYTLQLSWRRSLRWIIGMSLAINIGFCILLFSRLYIYHNMPPAIVVKDLTPVYTGPSISYFQQAELLSGTEMYITLQTETWAKYITSDNQEGWIPLDAIAFVYDYN